MIRQIKRSPADIRKVEINIVIGITGLAIAILVYFAHFYFAAALFILVSATVIWLYRRYKSESIAEQESHEITQGYIDLRDDKDIPIDYHVRMAVDSWKEKGQAVDFIKSLHLPNSTKSEILIKAAQRHKGKLPKNNPFAEQ